jgi:hypothetical protein
MLCSQKNTISKKGFAAGMDAAIALMNMIPYQSRGVPNSCHKKPAHLLQNSKLPVQPIVHGKP